MQKTKSYTINLTEIKGKGEFECPKCGTKFSPDDVSEDAYTILEPVTNRNCLEKIILQCNKCRSQIHLTGFQGLNQDN